MRKPLAIAATLVLFAATSTAQARHTQATWKQRTVTHLRHQIQHHRVLTWHYQDRAGVTRTYSKHTEKRTTSLPFLAWIKHLWIHRQARARRLASHRYLAARGGGNEPAWWLQQAACIRSHEGAWTSNTGNGYYGAYQFLLSTWQSVGGRGYPYQASPAEQTYRAWRVWQRDGGSWREWSTAGICGLS